MDEEIKKGKTMAIIVDDPNTIDGVNQTDPIDYTTVGGRFRVQLRKKTDGNIVYYWTRVTVLQASNCQILSSLTLASTAHPEMNITVGPGWATGNNQIVGSIYCSKALGVSPTAVPKHNRATVSQATGDTPRTKTITI
jgi:hypothetical protein